MIVFSQDGKFKSETEVRLGKFKPLSTTSLNHNVYSYLIRLFKFTNTIVCEFYFNVTCTMDSKIMMIILHARLGINGLAV